MKTCINYFSLAILVLFSISVHAQVFLEDINTYDDQLLYKKIHDVPPINEYYPFVDGHGNYPDLSSKKEFPKKIALVSFYVWDNNFIDDIKSPKMLWAESSWITTDNENRLANELSKYSVNAVEHRFDSLGIDVISPKDFTASQKRVYDSLQIHYATSYRKKVPDSIQYGICAASQYHFMKIPLKQFDYLFSDDMGNMAELLGVDAVLVIENQVEYDGRTGSIHEITMNLYGANPVKKSTTNTVKNSNGNGYNNGLLYLSMVMDIDAVFTQFDDTKLVTYENFIGIDKLMMLIVDQMYINYNARTKITPKVN
jgi:hypothetical protein